MTNPMSVPVPGVVPPALAYFKLKNSESYRFWRGRRLIDLKKGVIHSVSTPEDVQYFRARQDVLAECDAAGNILGAAAPGALDPKKAKSFKTYGAPPPGPKQGQPGAPPPPPPAVMVGRVPNTPPPVVPATNVVAIPPGLPTPPAPKMAPPVTGQTQPPVAPSVPPPPPVDRKTRSSKAQAIVDRAKAEAAAEPMTPIEFVDGEGKTAAKIQPTR